MARQKYVGKQAAEGDDILVLKDLRAFENVLPTLYVRLANKDGANGYAGLDASKEFSLQTLKPTAKMLDFDKSRRNTTILNAFGDLGTNENFTTYSYSTSIPSSPTTGVFQAPSGIKATGKIDNLIPVVPGFNYTLSLSAYSASAQQLLAIFNYKNAKGVQVGTADVADATWTLSSGWSNRTVTTRSPAGAAWVEIKFVHNNDGNLSAVTQAIATVEVRLDVFTSIERIRNWDASGVPKTALATAVQTSLNKADSAYQRPASGIPRTDLNTTDQGLLNEVSGATSDAASGNAGKLLEVASGGNITLPTPSVAGHAANKNYVDTEVGKKYTKPFEGIPRLDLETNIQSALSQVDNATTSALANRLALRSSTGTLQVGTPANASDAVTKLYADFATDSLGARIHARRQESVMTGPSGIRNAINGSNGAITFNWAGTFEVRGMMDPRYSSSTVLQLSMPATGVTIQGVAGAGSRTVTSSGITLNANETLFYAPDPFATGVVGSESSRWRIAGASSYQLPDEWIFVATNSALSVYWGDGQSTTPWNLNRGILRTANNNSNVNFGNGGYQRSLDRVQDGIFEFHYLGYWGTNASAGSGSFYVYVPITPKLNGVEYVSTAKFFTATGFMEWMGYVRINTNDTRAWVYMPTAGNDCRMRNVRTWDGVNGVGTGIPYIAEGPIDANGSLLSFSLRYPFTQSY